jgi:hypothetical protein
MNKLETTGSPSNGAAEQISYSMPYISRVAIEGASALLFHRWSVDGVEEKAKAAKGSKAKKTDDIESYVYRDEKGSICLPSEYLRMSIIHAAKFRQDPRSPRKSAMDLFKAGIVGLNELCSLGSKDWDYLDRRRVMIQRNGITRVRPGFKVGWKIECDLLCNLPEYIPPAFLNETIQAAGRLIGVGDMRPTFGRFNVVKFEVVTS